MLKKMDVFLPRLCKALHGTKRTELAMVCVPCQFQHNGDPVSASGMRERVSLPHLSRSLSTAEEERERQRRRPGHERWRRRVAPTCRRGGSANPAATYLPGLTPNTD